MLRKVGLVSTLLLALPAFAHAWTVTAKIGSGAGTVQSGTKTIAKGQTGDISIGYFKAENVVGNSQAFTITPTTGYSVSSIIVNGADVTADATVFANGVATIGSGSPIRNSQSLVVYFKQNLFTVTAAQPATTEGRIILQACDVNGNTYGARSMTSISGLKNNSYLKVTAYPNADYKVATIGGLPAAGLQGDVVSKVIPVTASGSVTAVFAQVATIKPALSLDKAIINPGESVVANASSVANVAGVSYAFSTSAQDAVITPSATQASIRFPSAGNYAVTVTATATTAGGTTVTTATQTVSVAINNACLNCHNNRNPQIIAAWNAGTHGSNSTTCSVCHVGTSTDHAAVPASIYSPDAVDKGDSYLPAPAEYAGSNACAPCHPTYYDGWTKSLHNKPTKYLANQGEGILVNDAVGTPAGNDFAEGFDFNDAQFQTKYGYANPFANQIPNAPILKKVGTDYVIQIGATQYKINRTQGGNGYWKQRYYTEVGGGNYVLPIQFNEVSKRYSAYNAQYWYASAASNTPRFSQAYGSAELLAAFKTANAAGGDGPASSSWENRCAGCHQSGVTVKLVEGEVVSGYADINVGCEACHGPAAAHVAAPTKTNIVNPNDYLSQTGGAFKAVETCGKCHQRGESRVYLGAGSTHAEYGTPGSIQKKIEAPAKLSGDLTTALFFPMGGDLFGGGWYTDNVGVFGTKGSMTYNGYAGFPTYAASNSHHQQWEDLEQGKHGANYAETTPGAQKMACWSCHDMHSPKGSHNTRSKLSVGGVTLTNLSADNNTLCLACHAGKGKFAALTLGALQAEPTGADVVAAVNAHVSARIPGKTISAANYLAAGRKGGGSSTYGLITYKNGQCVSCHMPLTPSSSGLRVYTDALGKGQGDMHSHTMKTILTPVSTAVTSCSGCHGDFTDFAAERLQAKTVEAGQTTAGVSAAAGFVGANSCKSCHLEQFAGYTNTFHNKPLKTLALGETIFVNDSNNNGINDFKDGLDFNSADAALIEPGAGNWNNMKLAGFAPRLSYDAGKYYITIGAVKYEIARTQGGNGKWKQRYHTKIGNAYYVLPVQYDEISKRYEAYNNGNWYKGDNTPWITAGTSNTDVLTIQQVSDLLLAKNVNGGATGTSAKGPSTGSWDNRCAACHQTGVAIEYKSVTGTSPMEVVASSADLNIGCESCHGGGAAHMKNPYAAGSIVNPAKMTNAYRATEVCGQCHARVEGFAHFSSASGRVYAGVEAPSQSVEGSDETKAKSYTLGETLLSYIYKVIPNAWKLDGSSAASAPSLPYVQYEDVANKMVNGVAANGHHQQWHDLSSGNHGPSAGMACFACHDPHKANSGNIKTSTKMGTVTVAVKSTDNSLCLSCHAGKAGAFVSLTATDVAGIAAQPKADAVMEAVYAHLVARAGYPNDETKKASWKAKYLSSVQADGTTPATFGIAVYRVGECISCHMPFSSKSGIRVSTNANGRAQGDQRAHTMKTLWPGLTNVGATGLNSSSPITSCSACHPVSLAP